MKAARGKGVWVVVRGSGVHICTPSSSTKSLPASPLPDVVTAKLDDSEKPGPEPILVQDQGHGAACILAGIDKRCKWTNSIAAPRICDLLQLR